MTLLRCKWRGHVLEQPGACPRCAIERQRHKNKMRTNRPPGVPYSDRVEYVRVAKFQPDDVIVVFTEEFCAELENILTAVLAHASKHSESGKAAKYALSAITAARKGWDQWQGNRPPSQAGLVRAAL